MVTFAALGAQLTCAGSKSSAAPEPRRVERFQALAAEMSAEAQSLRWKLKIRGIELAILTLESQPVRYSDGVEHLVSTVQSSGVGGWFGGFAPNGAAHAHGVGKRRLAIA